LLHLRLVVRALQLGSAHWFFLSDAGNKISAPHQFYWVFIGFIFFIVVSLITKPCRDEVIQKYSLDIRPQTDLEKYKLPEASPPSGQSQLRPSHFNFK
jgi:Na+(H+)/acetate symporter ActP